MKKSDKVEASTEQVLTAVKGLRLESLGALGAAEKESRRKENLNPQTTRKRSALAAAKSCSANRFRDKMSKPKSTKGGVLFGTRTQRTISTVLAASSLCGRRGLAGFVQPPEFLWKYHNVKS